MQRQIPLSLLTSQTPSSSAVHSESSGISSSSSQPDKFYKDRSNRYIKVVNDREVKKFAPLRRVDDGDKEIQGKRESHGSNLLKQQYRALIEVTNMKLQQLQTQKALLQSKRQRAGCLMERLELALGNNHNLKKIRLASNEHKRGIFQFKRDYGMNLNQIHLQAHSNARKIDQDQFTIARQYKMSLFETNKIHSKLSEIRGKTNSLKQQELTLDKQIDQVSLKVQEEDQTINELNRTIDKTMKEVKISAIQVSVLKMQLSPLLRVGFSNVSLDPVGDRQKILDKNYIVWPKTKIKNLDPNQIRDFLVMQLYPSWRRMLSKMSYEFVGYHQILCYGDLQESGKMPDLSLYLPQKLQSNRHTTSKTKSYVLVYSPLNENRSDIMSVFMTLQGLSNPLLVIQEVKFEKVQNGNTEIQILYSFMGCDRSKRFEVVQLKDLTREAILRWLPAKEEKNVLMKLQVPLIFNSLAERSQVEQVYDLLKRWK